VTARALVLGGGGITGAAWETGIIAGLAGHGLDLAAADVIIGTSAGAVVGAVLESGVGPEQLYERQLGPPSGELVQRLGVQALAKWVWILLTARDVTEIRRRLGRIALAARTVSEADRRQVIEGRLNGKDWPARPLKITAVDAHTGELVIFDAAGEACLIDAVAASTATPGVQPPVTIGGHRFIDGGVGSPANACLAAGYDRVVIVAPEARGTAKIPRPGQEAAALAAAGSQVVVIAPDRNSVRARGRNPYALARRPLAARAGRAQAAGRQPGYAPSGTPAKVARRIAGSGSDTAAV
jgi:NTE family protein